MKRMKVTLRRRGQALVETALTVTILVLLSLGIVQFGYAFMQLEMITNAARDGARFGAARVNRDDCRCLQATDTTPNTGTIAALVKTEIGNVMDASLLSVTVVQTPPPCGSGCPCSTCDAIPSTTLRTVDVTVSGTVPYMFRLIGTGYGVNRVVKFRDEQVGS